MNSGQGSLFELSFYGKHKHCEILQIKIIVICMRVYTSNVNSILVLPQVWM
jgi:hypothetical protein